MENFKELEISEMTGINGGNLAYDIGYACGKAIKDWQILTGLSKLVGLL